MRHRNVRRRTQQEPGSNERWLVSYADFMTLMFAFFVVLFASSQTDKNKLRAFSENVSDALKQGPMQSWASAWGGASHDKEQGGTKAPSPNPGLSPALPKLKQVLDAEIRKGSIQVHLEPRGLIISLKEAAFFPSAGDELAPSSYGTMEKVAAVLRQVPNAVRLEGHTDSLPVRNGRFRSNWELSAARSIAMLRMLNERFGVPAKRMAVVGYAETVSVDTNENEVGRTHNRRVDIAILNEEPRDLPQN